MALILRQTVTDDFNSVRADGTPGKTKALQVYDTETSEVIFTFNHASDGTATAEVDASQCVTEDTVAIKSASITLTDAQIKALPTTTIDIVAAPPAGQMYELVSVTLISDFSAGEYTNINANAYLSVRHPSFQEWAYLSNSSGDTIDDFSDLFGSDSASTAKLRAYFPYNSNTGPRAIVAGTDDVEAQKYELFVSNSADGNFTGGNAANTLKVTVLYTVIDV